MRYFALQYWWKFCTNWNRLGGAIYEKLPKSGLQWYFSLLRKYLKIYNLATTDAILMKLTTIMYLHRGFNLEEDWGLNDKV